MAHGAVKNYGGEIAVSSKVGKRNPFASICRGIETGGEPPEACKAESLPLGVHKQMLFVDDEEAIADVGCEILEHLGYEVMTRTSSIEALELFRSAPQRFDLVITDMAMPNMTGEKLAQELLKTRSDIPIILCTGFSEHITNEKAKAIGIRELVMKPVAMKELAKAIQRALNCGDI